MDEVAEGPEGDAVGDALRRGAEQGEPLAAGAVVGLGQTPTEKDFALVGGLEGGDTGPIRAIMEPDLANEAGHVRGAEGDGPGQHLGIGDEAQGTDSN